MPKSNSNRSRGKHKAGRKQYTGNKFIIVSAEAQLIQRQLSEFQQYMQMVVGALYQRVAKLDGIGLPPEPAAEVGNIGQIVPETAANMPTEAT